MAPQLDTNARLRRTRSPSREQRVVERRRQLGEITLRLARERGFDALSVNELAERASMSVGGLYRYIKTKSDLLVIICDEINRGLSERMSEAARTARGITAKLSAAYAVYWDTCWDNAFAILLAYREWQSLPVDARERYIVQEKEIAARLCDLIRAGVASEEFLPANEILLSHDMIMLAQMKAVKGWVFEGYQRNAVYALHLGMVLSRLQRPSQPG
jgi:TetR/AcrR family transcriptional regulator, cholesterol catabolism regulator